MLFLLGKRSKTASGVKMFCITLYYDPSHYISSAEDIFVVIKAVDAPIRNDHELFMLHTRYSNSYAPAILDDLHNCYLD